MQKTKLVLLLAALVGGAVALANDRLQGELTTIQKLNGSPKQLGAIYVVDGGSHNSWNTTLADGGAGGTFDAGYGDALLIHCTEAMYLEPGSSATSATTASTPVEAKEKFYMILKQGQNSVAILQQDAGTAGGCYVKHQE